MNLLPAKESFKRLACVHEICSVHEYVNDTIKVNVDRLPQPDGLSLNVGCGIILIFTKRWAFT